MRMEMHRGILWYWCICIVLRTSNGALLDFDLVTCFFSYVNYSIGGRVCKAGMTPRPLKEILMLAVDSLWLCSWPARQ
jgi:hypothetical protein